MADLSELPAGFNAAHQDDGTVEISVGSNPGLRVTYRMTSVEVRRVINALERMEDVHVSNSNAR